MAQQYLPDSLLGARFFDPSTNGRERALVEQWRALTRAENPDEPEPPVE